jgi:general secretion pathway protein G
MGNQTNHRRGFTLIELMVATSILAVLSVIGIVSYSSVNKRSRDAKRKSDLEQVRSALELYRSDKGFYPTGSDKSFVALTTLDGGGGGGPLVPTYLPNIPMDPKSSATIPVTYFYAPLGVSAPFYSYCLCGNVELESAKNDCQALGVTLPAACNYAVRNP